MVIEFN